MVEDLRNKQPMKEEADMNAKPAEKPNMAREAAPAVEAEEEAEEP